MLRKYLKLLSGAVGRKNFSIDERIDNRGLTLYLLEISFSLLRGLPYKFLLNSCGGIPLVGKNSTFSHGYKISIGCGSRFGNNVNINGLCASGIVIGHNFTLLDGATISGYGVIAHLGESLTIGNDVGISQNFLLQIRGPVRIGNDVIIGPNVSIFSENHNLGNLNEKIRLQGVTRRGVTIGSNVWIGANVTILDGVVIGDNVVIAAGAVVTKSIPSNKIGMGVPARQKDRKD